MSRDVGVTEHSPVAPIVCDQAVPPPPSTAFQLFAEQLDAARVWALGEGH
jgi:hypothetical protein